MLIGFSIFLLKSGAFCAACLLHRCGRQLFGFKAENFTTVRKTSVPSYKKVTTLKTVDPLLSPIIIRDHTKTPILPTFSWAPLMAFIMVSRLTILVLRKPSTSQTLKVSPAPTVSLASATGNRISYCSLFS